MQIAIPRRPQRGGADHHIGSAAIGDGKKLAAPHTFGRVNDPQRSAPPHRHRDQNCRYRVACALRAWSSPLSAASLRASARMAVSLAQPAGFRRARHAQVRAPHGVFVLSRMRSDRSASRRLAFASCSARAAAAIRSDA